MLMLRMMNNIDIKHTGCFGLLGVYSIGNIYMNEDFVTKTYRICSNKKLLFPSFS